MIEANQPTRSLVPAFLRDIRIIQIIAQSIFVVIAVIIVNQLWTDMSSALAARGQAPNFEFLGNRAGFALADAGGYSQDDAYRDAYWVGVVNTIRVVGVGLVATTILGIFVGIFLLSSNWLIRNISQAYVEVLRNTPILLQIIAWYFIGLLALPELASAIQVPAETMVPTTVLIRYLFYVVFVLGVWLLYMRRLPTMSHRRPLLTMALPVAVIAGEIASGGLTLSQPMVTLLGLVNLAAIVLVALLTVVNLAPREGEVPGAFAQVWSGLRGTARYYLLGLLVGQVLGLVLAFITQLLGVVAVNIMGTPAFTEVMPAFILSIRGAVLSTVVPTVTFNAWLVIVVIGLVVAAILWFYFGHLTETTGRPYNRGAYALLAVFGFALLGWLIVSSAHPKPDRVVIGSTGQEVTYNELMRSPALRAQLTLDEQAQISSQPLLYVPPRLNPAATRVEQGMQITANYLAVFLGLVVYTSAFIAEIVRAGIQAVPRGQIEASRAVGLTNSQMLRLIIMPQALRVIIPPLGNQYLNLAKNSSLAIAVAYTDLYQVMNTVINQSGQSVTGILIIMVTYLIISLIIAVVMNLVNRRFQLVTR